MADSLDSTEWRLKTQGSDVRRGFRNQPRWQVFLLHKRLNRVNYRVGGVSLPAGRLALSREGLLALYMVMGEGVNKHGCSRITHLLAA